MSAGGRGATAGRCVLSRLFALAGTLPYARVSAMPSADLAQRGATASAAEIRSLTVEAFPDRAAVAQAIRTEHPVRTVARHCQGGEPIPVPDLLVSCPGGPFQRLTVGPPAQAPSDDTRRHHHD
jgi:hypothetical protein